MKNTFGAHFSVGNIYESLDKGVYEYTNAILGKSFFELDKGFAFPRFNSQLTAAKVSIFSELTNSFISFF